jgi:hypothetical protein
MAIISQDILQRMFDPMDDAPLESNVIKQQAGFDMQQADQVPVVSSTDDGTSLTQTTTLPPSIPGFKVNPKARPEGGAMKQEYKDVPLYTANKKYISDINNKILNNNIEYSTLIFQTLGKLPVVNGKTIPLSEFSTIFSKDKKAADQILGQATEFSNDPNIDIETGIQLIKNNNQTIALTARLANRKKVFRQNLASVVPQADADADDFFEKGFNVHQLLFDENGNIRDKKQFEEAALSRAKQRVDQIQKEIEQVPPPTSGSWMRSDMPTSIPVLDQNGRLIGTRVGTNPSNYGTSVEGYNDKIRSLMNQQNLVLSKAKELSYDKVFKQLTTAYNKEKSGAIFLGADEEAKWKNQKGGEKEVMVSEPIPFGYTTTQTMLYSKGKDAKGKPVYALQPQVAEFHKIMEAAGLKDEIPSLKDVIVDIGGVKSELPDGLSGDEYTGFKLFAADVLSDMIQSGESFINAQKRSKLLSGTIYFQGAVGGENKYHAFHIKFDKGYLNQSKFSGGTEEAPKYIKANPELITNGFTVYIPAALSSKVTNFGIKQKEAINISDAEALLNLDENLPPISVTGGGSIQLVKDPVKQTISVTGYGVALNPNTLAYDTIPYGTQTFPVDQSVNIDGYINNQIWPRVIENYRRNREMKMALDALEGVKDPKQLQQPKQ